jgi:hypothetical protein
MRRETIEMSYFATCGFCSEIIVAERIPMRGRKLGGKGDRRSSPMNDNWFRVLTQDKSAPRRARRVQPAA